MCALVSSSDVPNFHPEDAGSLGEVAADSPSEAYARPLGNPDLQRNGQTEQCRRCRLASFQSIEKFMNNMH